MAVFAGSVTDFSTDRADWVFVDQGFAGSVKGKPARRTTGVWLPNDDLPRNFSWSDAVAAIMRLVERAENPINIMIEAPLSIAFASDGNPTLRAFERQGESKRYWYMQGGLVTLFAASILLHQLAMLPQKVFLYEAIISFKRSRTDHAADASLMASTIADHQAPLAAHQLKSAPTDELVSSTFHAGLDFGIPPVFSISPHH